MFDVDTEISYNILNVISRSLLFFFVLLTMQLFSYYEDIFNNLQHQNDAEMSLNSKLLFFIFEL